MKSFIILTLLFSFNLPVTAQEDVNSCSSIAEYYGHHQNPHQVSSECINIVKANSTAKTSYSSPDGNMKIYAHRNLIYIERFEDTEAGPQLIKTELLSGNQTKLNEIIAIKVDEVNQHLYVLNKNPQKFSFGHYNLNFIGNVAPLRYFEASELYNPINFDIDIGNKMVYFIDQDDASIKKYNLHADINSKHAQHSIKILLKISGDQTQLSSPDNIIVSGNEVQVYESEKLYKFPIN